MTDEKHSKPSLTPEQKEIFDDADAIIKRGVRCPDCGENFRISMKLLPGCEVVVICECTIAIWALEKH